jgi:hypothetical protein
MYHQKLIASIKANGKILREFKDTVYIPFNSEYSILLKNLETKRVIVNVYIDGENVVPGGLVLTAGQEVDLERSIKNNNLTEGNKFKFIERTGAVEKHRGIKLEDGLIRVEYQFEKIQPVVSYPNITWNSTTWTTSGYLPNTLRSTAISSASGTTTGMALCQNSVQCSTTSYLNDVGITVPGSVSNQQFTTAAWFATEIEKHNIVLKLLGETPDNKVVTEAITVKSKPKCITCGKQNKATAKFCSECGTGLQIVA